MRSPIPRARAAIAALVASGVAHAQPAPSPSVWSTLGGDAARSSHRTATPAPFVLHRWTCHQTPAGQTIGFNGHAGVAAVAVPTPRVFATGVIAGQNHAVAIDAEGGSVVWATPVPHMVLDSWAPPTFHEPTQTVLYAVGVEVVALNAADGAIAWRTALPGPPLNAAPAATDDRPWNDRAFVSTHGGFADEGRLVCINLSPRHPVLNPYDPGDVVWSADTGSSAGGSPACHDGVVYVCSTGLHDDGHGRILAFDARATATPAPRWVFRNPEPNGFFGGLAVRETLDGLAIYAATYSYYGGTASANMVKVNARDGSLLWSVPCNRTDSIPVVLDDCRIALSSGIVGFGSVPMVELFHDYGDHAERLWDTATATWNDANANGAMDFGEFTVLGGWTTQPVAARGPHGRPRLLVGSIPIAGDPFGPYTGLYELDLDRTPGEPGFIVQHTAAAGSTPAMLGSGVYSLGVTGLAALGAPPPRPDVNGDGRIDVDDLHAWTRGTGFLDVDRSGSVDAADQAALLHELRRNELRDAARGRR